MESYMLSVIILGVVILVKVGIILCLYAHRVRRLRQLHQLHVQQGRGAAAYPQQPYTQSSAIVNCEVLPEPISTVCTNEPYIPSTIASGQVQPPAYNEVVTFPDDKPPSYEQVVTSPTLSTTYQY